MSGLVDLVKLRLDLLKSLDDLDPTPLADNLHLINHVITNNPNSKYQSTIDEKVALAHTLNTETVTIINDLRELVKTIESDIDSLADQQLNTKEFQDKFKFDSFRSNPNNYDHKMALDEHLKNVVKTRVSMYSDQIYPGLVLGCKFQEWVDLMIASDPLYITNYPRYGGKSLTEEVLSVYPEMYQRRVRVYEIKNQNYSILPKKQFSLVLSWDYLPWIIGSDIDKILAEVYNLLRPGGAFIFNYNNCDLISSVDQAKDGIFSWYSSHQIKNLCDRIGYEIVSFNDYQFDDPAIGYVSWAEIRKPGILSTVKRTQAMGAILSK
jgi:SAM-dependent methyltransferase